MRTFVAVEIDDAVRRRAAGLIDRLRAEVEGVSWVAPQNLHLTLKFLGEVDDARLPEVCRAVQAAVAAVGPFDFEVRGLGAFPRVQRPNNVWLGGGAGTEALAGLADRVESALKKLGFPREGKAFQPHLTLGRVRRGGPAATALARRIAENASFNAGQSRIREVVVFSSQLSPQGAIYTPVCRALLGLGPTPSAS
jgi:2'-5' RNA ligase